MSGTTMSGTIVQSLLSQIGQSQDDRRAREFAPDFAVIDERTPEELLRFVRHLAHHVNYYRDSSAAPAVAPDHDWSAFFPGDDVEARRLFDTSDGTAAAHLALLVAFLHLYQEPRAAINRLTAAHRDFFYQRVLRFQPRAPVPDRAHVVFEVKKGAAPVRVLSTHRLSAGKDPTGVELIYQPVRDGVVRSAQVDELRAVFIDPSGRGTVRAAPVANSSDGHGGALPAAAPAWAPFGSADLPVGAIGFALSAPLLRLREGQRTVTLTLQLSGERRLRASALQVLLSGEKGWFSPRTVVVNDVGQVVLTIDPAQPALVDYRPDVHGPGWAATAPIAQLRLRSDEAQGYRDLQGAVLHRAQLTVTAAGLTTLDLWSDSGALDASRAFQPFGSQPVPGTRFRVGCAEALEKPLSEVRLQVQWSGTPDSFADLYRDYMEGQAGPANFHADIALPQGRRFAGEALFVSGAASREWVFPLAVNGRASDLAADGGAIEFTLSDSFLYEEHRRRTLEILLARARGATTPLLKEPYTPKIRGLSLSYVATSDEVRFDGDQRPAADAEVPAARAALAFFHVDCFGQRLDHPALRAALGFPAAHLPLLPEHEPQGAGPGELLIGLSGVAAGDTVSLLVQVAEGSADPDITWPTVRWSALCANHFKALGPDELVLDTTAMLRRSGLVVVTLPAQATSDNTLLPAGKLWLRAAVADHAGAVTRLLAVLANGVEVAFVDRGNDPAHLALPLPAGAIQRLATPIPAIKSVAQPFASFGGRKAEPGEELALRAAERLRHKDRAVTPWDYERLVLGAFPEIHQVNCVPHARDGSFRDPGHVLCALVPDLRNQSARDPLEPRVDADTLARVQRFLAQRAAPGVQVHVKNPEYQRIQLRFRVKFYPGRDFNAHRALLVDELKALLSPWVAGRGPRGVSWGGRVYRSAVLNFVEERDYVDYATDFQMLLYAGATASSVSEAQPARPDAILVSHAEHVIDPVTAGAAG